MTDPQKFLTDLGNEVNEFNLDGGSIILILPWIAGAILGKIILNLLGVDL